MTVQLVWPRLEEGRGPGFWLRPSNLVAARRKLRTDHSNEWRYEFMRDSRTPAPPPGCNQDPDARSRSVAWLTGLPAGGEFRCVILGDTGEGDHSQYALLPVIRALKPHLMVINGDVAYPAGRDRDYEEGYFRPYAGLGIPIWAVPGNHDYYSENRGREFHEIFCTELRRAQWNAAGLILKPQPGTYWELGRPDGERPLVLLGVDTGLTADLEGARGGGLLGLGSRQPRDTAQLEWLEWRLRAASEMKASVVLLFHIPALVNEDRVRAVRLDSLHRIIARFPCVRLVIAAHEHNYQRYDPATFALFLEKHYGAVTNDAPAYLVSGGGGAYLMATDFDAGKKTGYCAASRYPEPADWKTWAPRGLRLVAKAGLGKSVLNLLTIEAVSLKRGIAEESDADRPERLSFLVLDHSPDRGTSVTPVFVDDLAEMYPSLPANTPVRVQDDRVLPDPAELQKCIRDLVISF